MFQCFIRPLPPLPHQKQNAEKTTERPHEHQEPQEDYDNPDNYSDKEEISENEDYYDQFNDYNNCYHQNCDNP